MPQTPSTIVVQRQFWRAFFSRNPRHPFAGYRVIDKGFRYRVDDRPPSIIKENGLFPTVIRLPMEQITMKDVAAYQRSRLANPGIVSTSETISGAREFARQRGQIFPGIRYIYKVDISGLVEFPQSHNIPWYQRLFYSEQEESMIVGGIESGRVEFVEEMDTGKEADVPHSGFE